MVQRAEGQAQSKALEGEGESKRRIAIAEAHQKEIEAQGEGEARARTLNADAHLAELEAEGAGQKAILLGEAEGKRQLAESLNAYNQAALQLSVYPDLIGKLPEIAASLAAPFASVDRIVMIDGGGGNGSSSPMAKYGSTVPLLLAQAIETLRAVGFDLPAILTPDKSHASGNGSNPDALEAIAAEVEGKAGAPPLDPPAERPQNPGL
jgi:flotillin